MSEEWFIKTPCKHCPFRRDVKPVLTPERGEELAYAATNPYNSFLCHKTMEYDDYDDDGDMKATEDSKTCAGFLTLQINEGMDCPKGFTPADNVYSDAYEMIDAYEDQEDQ